MKKILFVAILSIVFGLISCIDVLDKRPLDSYIEEDIWSSVDLAQDNIYGRYGILRSLGHMDGANDLGDMQSDLSLTNWVSSRNKSDAGWVANNDFAGWNKFGDVRNVNLAIRNLNNPVYRAAMTAEAADHLLGQCYLIKAAIYYQQARKYGGWVIVDDVLDEWGDDSSDEASISKLKLPRATMKETYDYIIENLLSEEHINMMKVDVPSGQAGRGAGYALLSEVAIHGAAYLEYYDKINPATYYKKAIWAVEQLDALNKYSLESSDKYHSMFDDYSYSQASKEVILGVYRNSTYTQTMDEEFRRRYGKMSRNRLNESKLNYAFQPFGAFELDGYGSYYPDPRMVEDAYYVIDEDGKACRWEESQRFKKNFDIVEKDASEEKYYKSGTEGTIRVKRVLKSGSQYTNVSDLMFSNRDKRFYESIVYDGSKYMQSTVYMRTGGNFYPDSYKAANNRESGTTTGYVFKKFVPQTLTLGDGKPQLDIVTAIIFRLGRCYLNAAEAYIGLGNESKAREYINKTRTVHGGLPALTDESGPDLKKIYMDERCSELTLENDRYWTLLRTSLAWGVQHTSAYQSPWGERDENDGYNEPSQKAGYIARLDGTKQVPFLLIEVPGSIMNEDEFMKPNAYSYIPTPYVSTDDLKVFTAKKRYLLPVPQTELEQNENLFQNDNWK